MSPFFQDTWKFEHLYNVDFRLCWVPNSHTHVHEWHLGYPGKSGHFGESPMWTLYRFHCTLHDNTACLIEVLITIWPIWDVLLHINDGWFSNISHRWFVLAFALNVSHIINKLPFIYYPHDMCPHIILYSACVWLHWQLRCTCFAYLWWQYKSFTCLFTFSSLIP